MQKVCVLVFLGLLLQITTYWCKTTQIYSLTFLEAVRLKLKCWGAMLSLKVLGEALFLLLLSI